MNEGNQRREHWIGSYTAVFAVVCLMVYSLQIYYGKSLVFSTDSLSGDGLVQNYNFLVYYGNYLRELFRNLFIEHTFSIPEYDTTIGLGGGIISSLNMYTIGDPLNLLSVFVAPKFTEYLYNILIIVRLYLAGISYYLYCTYHSYSRKQILPGAIIYVFSFYTIAISIFHPHFLNPLIYFPLIALGVDKVLKERKPALFIVSCAVAAASSFYTFYMITVLIVIYGMFRYVQYHLKNIRILSLLLEIGRFALYYIIAIMIAAPIFLPAASAVLESSRLGNAVHVSATYELIYYIKLPIAFMNASADHYSALGYGAVGAASVILLFCKTRLREKAGFKIAFVLGTVFLLFPFFGHVLNGFGYAVNRWIWGYCFVVSLIVTEMFPDIVSLPSRIKWVMAGSTVVFGIPTFYFRAAGMRDKLINACIFLLIYSVVLTVLLILCKHLKNGVYISCFFIIAANTFLGMFGFYSPLSGNFLRNYDKFPSAWRNLRSGPFSVLDGTEEDFSRIRIDTSNLYSGVRVNSAMIYGVNSVSHYYSVINSNTSSFLHDMWIPTPFEHSYMDLDSRALLSPVMGVKYNIVKSGDELYLPYGYDKEVCSANGYTMHETDHTLPMVFTYDSIMSIQEYYKLSPTEKQQVLLQTAVVPDDFIAENPIDIPKVRAEDLEYEDSSSNYQIGETSGIEILNNMFIVKEPDAYITLDTDRINNVERCFAFENLWYEGDKDITYITIADNNRYKQFGVMGDLSNSYANVHNFLCNLGYSKEHGNSYTIRFSQPGVYTFDKIEILNQSLELLDQWIMARRAADMEYSFGEDSMLLHINLDRDKMLYASIPYSDGWQVSVDGKKVVTTQTADFGIGIPLNKGEHSVVFEYHTPYMRSGMFLSLAGIAGCIIICFTADRRLKKFADES